MSDKGRGSGATNKHGRRALTVASGITRSSAAEYLTFVAAAGKGGVETLYAAENVWLTQKMMGQLYDVNVRTVSEHLKKIFSDRELTEDSVIRKFRITATDGKTYDTQHYSLGAIIAVGYKVNSERAVQFRKWASATTQRFFATVQNKLHWAIQGQTAAELIHSRADARQDHMGLTSWKDTPLANVLASWDAAARHYRKQSQRQIHEAC